MTEGSNMCSTIICFKTLKTKGKLSSVYLQYLLPKKKYWTNFRSSDRCHLQLKTLKKTNLCVLHKVDTSEQFLCDQNTAVADQNSATDILGHHSVLPRLWHTFSIKVLQHHSVLSRLRHRTVITNAEIKTLWCTSATMLCSATQFKRASNSPLHSC